MPRTIALSFSFCIVENRAMIISLDLSVMACHLVK